MKSKPVFVCPSCKHEGVKQFLISEERFDYYEEPFTVRKKTRVCETCTHSFVPIEEDLRRQKLLKLMIVSLFLSKCDKSKKELTKINKKLQKIVAGLKYNEVPLRLKYLNIDDISYSEEIMNKEIIKVNPKLKLNTPEFEQVKKVWVENKKLWIKDNPEKHKQQLIKDSMKDKQFILNNKNYLIELVFELINELGDRKEVKIVNEEGKSEKITTDYLDELQTSIIQNQHNLKEYQEIYDKEIVEVRELLKEEEESDEDLEELSVF